MNPYKDFQLFETAVVFMLLIIHLFITGLFVLLGILFACGKGSGLIAGYNTASPHQKAKYDEKKLCKVMSKFMFILAACWLVTASSEIFKTMILLWIGQALFFVTIIVCVIYMNTGNHCKK